MYMKGWVQIAGSEGLTIISPLIWCKSTARTPTNNYFE